MVSRQISGGGGRNGGSFLGNIGCLLTGAAFLFFGFFIMKWLLYGLYILSPILFLGALLVNQKVVVAALKQHFALFSLEPGRFVIRSIFAVLFFPFVAIFLLLMAFGVTKAEQFQKDFSTRMGGAFGDPSARQGAFEQNPFGGGSSQRSQTMATDDDGFAEYEEIESHPLGEEMPQPSPKPEKDTQSPYDDLFRA